MNREGSRRILPTILIIIIIIVAVVAIVSLGRAIFGGGGDTADSEATQAARQALLDTTQGSAVSLTVRGKIINNDEFRSYRILITPSNRTMTTYSGYLGSPLKSKEYSNNVRAYEEFVYALDKAGFVNTITLTDDKNDTRGVCAAGNINEYDILKDDKSVKKIWTSTCSGITGSMKANPAQIRGLFQSQIPDFAVLVETIRE